MQIEYAQTPNKSVLPRRGHKVNTDEGDIKEIIESTADLLAQKRRVFLQSLEQRTKRRKYVKNNLSWVIIFLGEIHV